MISASFLASDFITDNELPRLLEAARKNKTRIIPLIVRPCAFTGNKNLGAFQAINDPEQPLSDLSENDKEKLYVKVYYEVVRSLQKDEPVISLNTVPVGAGGLSGG